MAVANFALPRRQTGLTKVAADAAVLRENGVREGGKMGSERDFLRP
jgi:hypothetical protein